MRSKPSQSKPTFTFHAVAPMTPVEQDAFRKTNPKKAAKIDAMIAKLRTDGIIA
jgi:hypothetical protein